MVVVWIRAYCINEIPLVSVGALSLTERGCISKHDRLQIVINAREHISNG